MASCANRPRLNLKAGGGAGGERVLLKRSDGTFGLASGG